MNQSIRRIIVIMITLVMAVPMIAGGSDTSYAASVTGAKAVNSGFQMIRVSWSAVKVELPQEPEESDGPAATEGPAASEEPAASEGSAASSDPADPAGAPGSASFSDTAASPDSADPAEAGSSAEGSSAAGSSDTVAPGAESGTDSAAGTPVDSNADTDTQNAGGESSDPVEPMGEAADLAADPAGQSVELAADEQAPAVQEDSDSPSVVPMAQADPKPVYDVITYKVYRATAKRGKYKLIKTTKATSFTNKGLAVGKRYYYKVIAYGSDGKKCGTSAIVSAKVAKQVTAKQVLLTKDGKAFNFRIAAKQKLYQYDTLQGGCANGGYAYLTLYNRKVERCKIVKVKLSTCSVVKVSASLPVYHANNLTYNTKKKRIVATCCTTKKSAKNRVVFINPKTLKVTSIKNIKLTRSVKNLPKKVRKKNKGYTAVAYNEKHNCYVARLRQNDNVVILNKDLKPLRYVVLKGKKTGLLAQGIESVGNYIYDVRSFKGRYRYCMVTVHTMSGKYVGQIKFPYGTAPGKELQCLFHDGKQFYSGIYYSTSQMNDTKKNHVNRVNLLYRMNSL